MGSQKGGLKDRVRSWFLFLKYKMKLKKQKIQRKRSIKLQKKQKMRILLDYTLHLLTLNQFNNKGEVFQ